MLRRIVCMLTTTVVLTISTNSLQAAVVVEHVGDTNPASEGFGSSGGTPGGPDATGKPNWRMGKGDLSQYWRLVGDNPAQGGAPRGGGFSPSSSLSQAFNDANGWTATWEAQLIAGARHNEAFMMIQDFDFFRVSLYDGNELLPEHGEQEAGAYFGWDNPPVNQNVKLGDVDPTDGFHTYQIINDANGTACNVNCNDDTISVWVDGVMEFEIARNTMSGVGDRSEFIFGRFPEPGNDFVDSDFLWALGRLETGQHPVGQAPESGFEWSVDASGNWNGTTNWNPSGVPNGRDVEVLFSGVATSGVNVTVDSSFTVNSIGFDNANSYSIGGAGSVHLQKSSTQVAPTMTVASGAHSFTADVGLLDDVTLNVASGSTLSVNALDLNGNTLTKTGAGRLVINGTSGTSTGSLVASEGVIAGSGTVGGTLYNQGVRVEPGNSIAVLSVAGNYSQLSSGTLAVDIAGDNAAGDSNGHDQLAVTGNAILDGALEVTATGFNGTRGQDNTVAVVTAASVSGSFSSVPTAGDHLGFGLFAGDGQGGAVVTYDATSANFTYLAALPGDADGDRDVDITDFNTLSNNFDPAGANSGTNDWISADFDHDGDVDITDFNGLSANFAPGGYRTSANQVPEPSSWLLTAMCALLISLVWGRRLP